MNTLDSAIRALTQVTGTAEHLDLIISTPDIAQQAFHEGFEAILQMAGESPEREKLLAGYPTTTPRLKHGCEASAPPPLQ